MITPLQPVKQIQGSPVIKRAPVSEVTKLPVPEGGPKHIKFTKNLLFSTIIQRAQWDAISRSRKGPKMPKAIDLTSTGIRRSASLSNKKGLFSKLSL